MPSWRRLRSCLVLQTRHASSTKSSDEDGFVLTSAGGSSRCTAFLIFFAGFEEAHESSNALYLEEAGLGLVTVPIMPLGKDRGGGCDAGAGAEGWTFGIEISRASLDLLG